MKKTIKIFCVPSHQTKERTSGVDLVRVIQPMSMLDGYEDEDVKFKVDVYQINKPKQPNWMQVAEKYDIIFMNYVADPWAFAGMGAMARHWKRKLVMDTDDNLHDTRPDNPAYNVYHKGSEHLVNLTAMYNEVDYMTTTNQYVKNVLMDKTYKDFKHIKIFPNYIDIDNLYTHRSPFKDTASIQLGWFGSTTHFQDLDDKEFVEGIDRIMKEYPNVTLKTIGANMTGWNMRWAPRYSQSWGASDVFTWVKEKFPSFMDETDIMVVPLASNPYTKCKSGIKYLEASSAGKPGVYQDCRQYRELIMFGTNGMFAQTAIQWYSCIKKLIDDKEMRRSMGQEAFKTIEKDHQLKNHTKERAEFFKEVLGLDK